MARIKSVFSLPWQWTKMGVSLLWCLTKWFLRVGIQVALFLLLVTVGVRWYQSARKTSLPDREILELSIDNELPEGRTLEEHLISFVRGVPLDPLSGETLEALWRAVEDSHIVGVFVSFSGHGPTFSQAEELREVFRALRTHNKPIWVHGTHFSTSSYFCASAATRICQSAGGLCAPIGFCFSLPFAKEGLEKLGVEPFVLHRKEYKNYGEMFTEKESSAATKEVYFSLLANLKKQLETALNQDGRVKQVEDFINRAPYAAQEASQMKAIDEIMERKPCRFAFKKSLLHKDSKPKYVSISRYLEERGGVNKKPSSLVAVIYLSGEIADTADTGELWNNVIDPGMLETALKKAGKDSTIKGVVLRLNSPGGSLIGSETLSSLIITAREKYKKPIVVSMGGMAASGGYWLAAPADVIVANEATLTGSIGIVMALFSTQELMKKLGIAWEVFASHRNSDSDMGIRPLSDLAKERYGALIDKGYDLFMAHVSQHRKLSPEQVESVAKGRVWLGAQAQEHHLVDKIGGLHVAVQEVCSLAKMEQNDTVRWQHITGAETSFLGLMRELLSGHVPFSLVALLRAGLASFSWTPTLRAQELLSPP
ncbi:MAG: signal peptide peptidase SppA [Holosporales bacterium]|jgi:protease-4|nr:signal peptide peptidase SppA [Holosporales bacterium]